MRTADLTGQIITYWVARANAKGPRQEAAVLRKHYGEVQPLWLMRAPGCGSLTHHLSAPFNLRRE